MGFGTGNSVLRVWAEGTVEVKVNTLRKLDSEWDDDERIEHLLQRLENVDGVRFKGNRRQWPRTPLAPLADPGKREAFLGVIADVVRGLNVHA